MKINITLLVVLFVLSFKIDTDQPLLKIPTNCSDFTVDHLGNAYLYKKDEIVKYLADGTLFNRFSNKTFGSISFIDATNPMKLLVMNRDLSVLFFLDNMLGKTTAEVDLNELGIGNASLACSSVNNGFWIYNPVDLGIRRYDEGLSPTADVHFLNQITGLNLHPVFMQEYNNKLYLCDPAFGIMVFDIFGTYQKLIPLKNVHEFQIIDQRIIYSREKMLRVYSMNTFSEDSLYFPSPESKKVVLSKEYIYSLEDGSLNVYPLKLK